MASLLQFMDFRATDFTQIYPDIQPGVGGVWFVTWAAFNPGPGQYNYDLLRNKLAAEAAIHLQDGSPKPLLVFLLVHTAPDETNYQGADYTPEWVKRTCPSIVIDPSALTTAIRMLEIAHPARGLKAVWQWLIRKVRRDVSMKALGKVIIPAYNKEVWWDYLAPAVRAFGSVVDGNENVIASPIAIGSDGELTPVKGPYAVYLPAGVEHVYGEQMIELFDVFRAAFTKTTLVINATPGSGRKMFTQEAIKKQIGFHMCGLQKGGQNYAGGGNEYGTMTAAYDTAAAGLPVIMESTTGLPNRRDMYWSLHYAWGVVGRKLKAIDVHPEWYQRLEPAWWSWIASLMGPPETAAEAVIVLRDINPAYPRKQWTGSNGVVSWQSDWPGNFELDMHMTYGADAPRVLNVGPVDALEYPECRRVNAAAFSISAAFHPDAKAFLISIRWLNEADKTMTVSDGATQKTFTSTSSEKWETVDVRIPGRTFSISGPGPAIHMIRAKSDEGGGGEPEAIDLTAVWAALAQVEATLANTHTNTDMAQLVAAKVLELAGQVRLQATNMEALARICQESVTGVEQQMAALKAELQELEAGE